MSIFVAMRGADTAAKSALSLPITNMKLPARELIPCVSKFCLDEWQDIWDCCEGIKLHSIYPTVGIVNIGVQTPKSSARRCYLTVRFCTVIPYNGKDMHLISIWSERGYGSSAMATDCNQTAGDTTELCLATFGTLNDRRQNRTDRNCYNGRETQ